MTLTSNLSPRVEIVGSFLPPEVLEQAIEQKCQGNISIDELHAVEDRVIDRLIDREIEAGLRIVTDGEMRRKSWDRDFWEGLDGMNRERIDTGHIYQDDPVRKDLLRFTGRIAFNPEHPFFEKYIHMQELAAGRAAVRQTIPSPGELYMRIMLMTNGEPGKIYESPETLEQDIIDAYRLTIAELYRIGCRHIQLDSSVWGRLSNPDFERTLLLGGMDPDVITGKLIHLINSSVADRPADLEITLSIAADETSIPRWGDDKEMRHLVRMLRTVDADAFLMPFDLRSPEHIEALSNLPEGKRAILGLVDGSMAGLESVTDIVEAINVAHRYVPMELLSISPTCGFKVRDRERQGLNYETQWTKIDLLKQAAAIIAGTI
jgi:5-methyltetrahydropteroyltriglutamate--homocysteine methyltransferase